MLQIEAFSVVAVWTVRYTALQDLSFMTSARP